MESTESEAEPSAAPTLGDGLTLNEVAEKLGVHYMTVYRYVRTGKLFAVKSGGEWEVSPSDLAAFSAPTQKRVSNGADRKGRTGRRRSLEARLIAADEPGAWSVVENALASGAEAPDIHHQLLIPAMQSIGRRWAAQEISIQEEHQATATALRLASRLGPLMRPRGRTRGAVILGAPADDHHSLGTCILGDLLRSIRFSVVDLGAHTPPQSFVDAIQSTDRLVAVGISASTADNEPNIRATIAAIKTEVRSIPVFLGGSAVRDRAHAAELGADEFADRSVGVLERFEAIATAAV